MTIEVVDVRETVLATGRVRTDRTSYAATRKQEDAAYLAAQDILIAAPPAIAHPLEPAANAPAAAKSRAPWLGLVDPGAAMGLQRRQPAMAGPCGTTPQRSGPGWGGPRVSTDGGL